MTLSIHEKSTRLAQDSISIKQLKTTGFFSRPAHQMPVLDSVNIERQSLEEALAKISAYALSKNSTSNKPQCVVQFASQQQGRENEDFQQLLKDLQKAEIEVSMPDKLTKAKAQVLPLLTVSASFMGLEAKLEMPESKPKAFFMPRGKLYCNEVIRLVRELFRLDQREDELKKITGEFQTKRLGL